MALQPFWCLERMQNLRNLIDKCMCITVEHVEFWDPTEDQQVSLASNNLKGPTRGKEDI